MNGTTEIEEREGRRVSVTPIPSHSRESQTEREREREGVAVAVPAAAVLTPYLISLSLSLGFRGEPRPPRRLIAFRVSPCASSGPKESPDDVREAPRSSSALE